MGTKINLYKQSGTDDGTSVNFNVPRSLTYGLNARANDDGGVSESDNCTYNTLNDLVPILNSASLVVTPSSYKEGKLYSVIPSDGSGDMSVVRATTATRVNSAGLVELVPYNLLTYSQDFSNVIWVKNEATISSNIATAPNGTTTADKLIENTANDSHHVYQNATANGVNTFSFYAKKGERTFVYAYADSVGQGKCFNLTSGTLGVNIISAPINATIESVGNDWFRCTITVSITSASALRIGLCSADGTFSYLGNGTSGAFIWGGQVVEGTIAKDYQKTETRLNIPRLDYSNGTCPSLLVEPQRTNLLTYSEDIALSLTSQANTTVTSNAAISPNGILNADNILFAASSYRLRSLTISATTNYTASLFFKNVNFTGTEEITLNLSDGVYGSITATIIPSNATATFTRNIIGWSSVSGKVEDFGNGWYRVSVSGASIGGGFGWYEIGCNVSKSILIWGLQLEAGSYPTSYIPTTSASVTRNADVLTRAGFGNTSTSGTLFFDFYAENITSPNGLYMLQLFAGSSLGNASFVDSNGLAIVANGPSVQVYNNGYSQLVQSITPTQGQRVKIAVRYNGTNISSSINGVASSVLTDTSVGVKNALRINNGEYGTQAFNAVAFFPSYLTDDQLELLTGNSFNTYAEMASYYNYTLQ